jgi:hypothetical protein
MTMVVVPCWNVLNVLPRLVQETLNVLEEPRLIPLEYRVDLCNDFDSYLNIA